MACDWAMSCLLYEFFRARKSRTETDNLLDQPDQVRDSPSTKECVCALLYMNYKETNTEQQVLQEAPTSSHVDPLNPLNPAFTSLPTSVSGSRVKIGSGSPESKA